MADTNLDLATVRTAVYNECGKPSTDDLANTSGGIIDQKIGYTVKRILRRLGGSGEEVKLGHFHTVANQQSYACPDNVVIDEVFWGTTTGDYGVQPFDLATEQFANIPNSSLAHGQVYWRSDEVITEMKRAQITAHYRSEIIDGYIYLYPTPGVSDDTVYYTYWSTAASVTDLGAEYERAVLLGATADCLHYLANRYRGRLMPSRDEGAAKYERASELDAMAKDYEERFEIEVAELTGSSM